VVEEDQRRNGEGYKMAEKKTYVGIKVGTELGLAGIAE
jgi:hypothetical protein